MSAGQTDPPGGRIRPRWSTRHTVKAAPKSAKQIVSLRSSVIRRCDAPLAFRLHTVPSTQAAACCDRGWDHCLGVGRVPASIASKGIGRGRCEENVLAKLMVRARNHGRQLLAHLRTSSLQERLGHSSVAGARPVVQVVQLLWPPSAPAAFGHSVRALGSAGSAAPCAWRYLNETNTNQRKEQRE